MSCPRVVARKVPPLLSGLTVPARPFPAGEKCHGASAVQLGANRSYPLPYAAPPLSCGPFLSKFSSQNGEGVSRSDGRASSACGDDGLNEIDLQTALHILVTALMGIAACVYELPDTELVYVASAVPKNLLHGLGVPGLGRMDHRKGPPISSAVRSSTQLRIKMLCSVAGRPAKASATSSLSISRSYPCEENTKLLLGEWSAVENLSISACGTASSEVSCLCWRRKSRSGSGPRFTGPPCRKRQSGPARHGRGGSIPFSHPLPLGDKVVLSLSAAKTPPLSFAAR